MTAGNRNNLLLLFSQYLFILLFVYFFGFTSPRNHHARARRNAFIHIHPPSQAKPASFSIPLCKKMNPTGMNKRPSSDDTEQDIIQMQNAFLLEKHKDTNFQPAAKVVKCNNLSTGNIFSNWPYSI